MNRFLAAAVLIVVCVCPAMSDDTQTNLTLADQQSLRRVAEELRAAILRQDPAAVLMHVSRNGLGCTDSQISRSLVKKYLNDKNSYLYMSLFDTTRYSESCGSHYPPEFPAISDREFFLGAKDGPIEILPLRGGAAQVIFRSSVKNHYQREWDFQKEGKEWKLIYGLIVGNCSCG